MPRSPVSRRDRSRSPLHRGDNEDLGETECRIHVADLSPECTKRDIEKAFDKWPLIEVWHARASCFAFVVLRHREDGQQAISELDGRFIGDARVRVTLALPRVRAGGGGGGTRRHIDSNMRCYQCGSRGHFSRHCDGNRAEKRNGNGYRSRSRERERRRDRVHSRSRSRSPRPRVIREDRRSSPPRRAPPSLSYKSRDNAPGYYTSPPRM